MELKESALRWSILTVVLLATCGCHAPRADYSGCRNDLMLTNMARKHPRTRVGSFASSTFATTFLSCSKLGQHSYGFNFFEKNGVVYTCLGGHLDIAHLRNAADRTAYLAGLSYSRMKEGRTQFSFNLSEDTTCYVEIAYPDDWQQREDADKADVLFDVATRLGEYFAFNACIWHEIATWFGYKSTGFYPEFGSAFSWEDMYSDLLGCRVGYTALYDTEHALDKAITLAIEAQLQELGGQPARLAHRAADLVRGDWFVGEQPVVIMKGRNFDIGLDDGQITPWLVPGMTACGEARPRSYPVPNLDFLREQGFSVRLEVEPRLWEKNKILAVLYPNGQKSKRFEPATQLHVLMDYIEKDAARRYGRNVAAVVVSTDGDGIEQN